MKMKKSFIKLFIALFISMAITSCGKDDAPKRLPIKPGEGGGPTEVPDILPPALAQEIYSPSLSGKPYKPIMVKYATSITAGSNPTWRDEKTRIIPYMVGFTANDSRGTYQSKTNRYGSRTDKPKQAITGRFYTKKVDGRWWLVDPEGYLHHHRGVASLRPSTSANGKKAFTTKYGGSTEQWLSSTQEEFASMGFHGTGAFCTNTYTPIQTYNSSNAGRPMTLSPSFGFLSAFKSAKGLSYPGADAENAVGLALHPEWSNWCESYIRTSLAQYLRDPNVLGFFSDNEINLSSMNSMILRRFLDINSDGDLAYKAAKKFMDDKGATAVTSDLNSEFAGIIAKAYYKGVKDALMKVDDKMLYLGSRLHGTPKYLEHVIRAAGEHCDVISINYYNKWSVELTTAVADWSRWADAPFIVTEFYTKAMDSGLPNTAGAGFAVQTEKDKAYAYQHFALGMLEAKNCVGWHWFKYQDDEDNTATPSNKGLLDNHYKTYPYLAKYVKSLNFNTYSLIDYFDK